MESTLHRQLKEIYCPPGAATEAPVGRYRVDIVDNKRLIEIQCSSLAALRDKTRQLLVEYHVEIIKPLVCRKRLIKLKGENGPVTDQRWSPKRGGPLDLFHELVHFTSVFPHRRLTIRTPLVEIEELRLPAPRTRRRRFRRDFKAYDQRLLKICGDPIYSKKSDLLRLLPSGLEQPFDTGQLAKAMKIDRWIAQRIAYCLRKTRAAKLVGKRGNALIYQFAARRRPPTAASLGSQ